MVWEIPQTGEVFTNYIDYLERRDFYHQKQFACEVTGRSNLSFYEAFESETQNSREVESAFPEPLRAPVLRKVQFSTIGRLEHLIAWVYEEFKADFWPREQVIAADVDTGEKHEAIVREKISFPERRRADGTIDSPAIHKYIVALLDIEPAERRENEALVDGDGLYRDRRVFSKVLLRSFLKSSLQKENWHGAPWTVRPKLAKEFNLPTEIPAHLQHEARMAEKKHAAAQKKFDEEQQQNTFPSYMQSKQQQRPLEVRPQKGQKHRFIQQDLSRYITPQYPQQMHHPHTHMHQVQYDAQGGVGQIQMIQQFAQPTRAVPAHNFHSSQFQPISGPYSTARMEMVAIPPPPPPVKFPTEDLDVPMRNGAARRPTLRFFSEDTPSGDLQEDSPNAGIKMASVGPLLEIWNTLNVLAEVFILDSFTVDDLAEAMRFSNQEIECELLSEMHCAVLKQIVDEKGDLKTSMPELDESSSDEDEEEEEEDEEEESPEPVAPRRATRSSLAKEEAQKIKERSPTPEQTQIHRAVEMLAERPWVQRLKERDFVNGGWQAILVGILYQLSLDERKKEKCDRILAVLAPMDQDATEEVAKFQYNVLEPNLRIELLQMIVVLAVDTPAVRGHLETMSQSMTDLRKKKIEEQRLRKTKIEELHKLDDNRKTIQQEMNAKNMPQSEVAKEAVDIVIPDVPADTNGKAESSEDSQDEAPRVLRRGLDRKRKREEDAAKKEKAKKAKEAAPKLSKDEMRLKKTLEEIEEKKAEIVDCEAEIDDITGELRETDCQRTRCLGRDRFCNRYVWFERNGMPFAGVPDTSTAHYGYANGRLWVQGPDAMDIDGLINRDKEDQADYQLAFGMTVHERKELEEGPTHLNNANQWGYIDDPAAVDELMAWLDERGNREKALRKELVIWKDNIVECMRKMRSHLDEAEAKKAAGDESQGGAMRVSTRTKTYVDVDKSEWQCLNWRNTLMEGALHSEGIPRKEEKKSKKKGTAEAKGKGVAVATKGGKMGTRGGK
ncbi:hypothetical protein EJ08DRAFT_657246 [Tothia fuscella]|uniref:DDT domain-containing protein n=1 Tax=Tothia fuscella TaxID=1048955 RepID=A0A9P4P0A8_9PEZI|nr:hypothetical protein EJ08DRAFT_657246 [Tothia fuscella]